MSRLNCFVLALALLIAAPGFAQEDSQGDSKDPAVQEVRKAIQEAQKEINAYREGGGKNEDPAHPAVKWLSRLWEYRTKYPGTEAAGLATYEGLHFLFHSGRGDDMLKRIDALAPDDTAWERLPNVLAEMVNETKDPSVLAPRLERVAAQSTSARIRATALVALGRSARSTDAPRARSLLERALREAPGTPAAREANNLLYEIASLSIGRPAPAFSAKAWKGSPVALDGYKNQALVIVFWSST